jgi:hypothetical protein
VVLAAYFKFPEPGSDDEPDEMMETEDAIKLFMSVGFGFAGVGGGML